MQTTLTGLRDTAEKGTRTGRARRSAVERPDGLVGDALFLDVFLNGAAEELSLERCVSVLSDARFRHPANATRKAHVVGQLQQKHGNAYVQRLLERLRPVSEESQSARMASDAAVTAGDGKSHAEDAEHEVAGRFAALSPSVETALRGRPAIELARQKREGSAKAAAPKGGGGELYYLVFLKPLLEGLWDQLHGKVLEHRHHLLALACLAKAAGPGADPMAVARFCKKYKLPLTMPVVGLIPRVLSKVDITGAVATGVKIMAALGPLLGKIRLRNAMLYALDEAVVPSGDSAEVGMILESASSPKQVMAAAKQKASEVKKLKADVERYAAKLKRIEAKLGAGKGTSGSGRR